MSPSRRLAFFRCPACGLAAPVVAETAVRCPGCAAVYPLAGDIPLLVPDWRAHEADIETARQTNPAWYVEAQRPEAVSPWRHHLRLRRLYVQGVLSRLCRDRGLDRIPRLLDLGCGDGNNLTWLAGYARSAHGCDYNLVRLARARARLPEATLFLADLNALPIRDDYYDVVFFNHVLEHIPNDAAALVAVRRVLRPGGLLILGVPNEGAWWWQLAYRRNPASLAGTDHVHFYTARQVTALLGQTGFRVRQVHGLGYGLPDWEWDTRLRQHKLIHDLFEIAGRLLIPNQCSSLYLLGEKETCS